MSYSADESGFTTLSEGMKRSLRISELGEEAGKRGLNVEEYVEEHMLLEGNYDESKEEYDVEELQSFVVKSAPKDKTPQDALELLRQCLSVKSILSTGSSFAERMEALRKENPRTTKLRVIGRGTYGTVFEIPGTDKAIKKTLLPRQSLYDEFIRGKKICASIHMEAAPIFSANAKFDGLLVPVRKVLRRKVRRCL
ncbi:hypothetical protein MMC10_010936 [Thelotrema lepadinum]|nr:hypothetical protein [Thelotrema lepadinum]